MPRIPKHPICYFSLTSSDPVWLQEKEMGLNLKNLTQVVKARWAGLPIEDYFNYLVIIIKEMLDESQ